MNEGGGGGGGVVLSANSERRRVMEGRNVVGDMRVQWSTQAAFSHILKCN